jgi:hypothetical protein
MMGIQAVLTLMILQKMSVMRSTPNQEKIKCHRLFVGPGESKWLLPSQHNDMHVLSLQPMEKLLF